MATRLDPGLRREIAGFGAGAVGVCMNCGTCTATCTQSTEGESFPRRIVHLLQVGNRERLSASLEPWLCYYCGECSDSCPRDADPAGIMMAARRHLTAAYDFTGLARRFYLSPGWQIGAMALVAAVVLALFALFHGPVVTDHVALNTFAPVAGIELADWIVAAGLGSLLLVNAWRMCRFVLGPGFRAPRSLWLSEAWTLGLHFLTQRRWRTCPGERPRWLKHLLLVSGYLTMLGLVVFGLRWFQTDDVRSVLHPTRLLGYYATAVLLYVSVDFLVGRARARARIHRSSELSDWLFLSLLLAVTLTGILVHALRLAGAPLATYVVYVVHLAITAPFLVVEVPFGKWSHMLYRPLAVYLATVRQKAAAAAGEVQAAA
ncbi:MAG TPA: 4Fe-4S dicluster domain-containing protein [Vicinamibacteria bacterium]|nr:4Fe-4S dicluster domain-containing protein [Vicinamibacteria bacterium]